MPPKFKPVLRFLLLFFTVIQQLFFEDLRRSKKLSPTWSEVDC